MILGILFLLISTPAFSETGTATWYKCCNKITACGTKFKPQGLYAAHKTRKCGSKVRVTDIKTGKTITVTINDRGPFNGHILDLTEGAARKLNPNYKKKGIFKVRIK